MAIYFKKGNWYIDYYANGKRKREKIGTSKALAETVLKKRKVEIAENKFLDIKREHKVKLEDFCEEFLNLHSKVNKRSWKADYFHLKRIANSFKGKYLYEITTRDIEKYKAERLKEVSPATVNRSLAVLNVLFNKAVAWGKLNANPAKSIKLLREPKGRLRFLEKEEIVKLLKFCRGHLKPIVIVALNTGMRRGEILGLKWHDIDFKRNVITLLNTKNGEKKEVPINEQVKTALIRVGKHPDSPYVFCNKEGRPYGKVRKSFFTACKKADIINFRFHDLRHTFASQLVMSGVDLNTVRELMGHKDMRMTIRYSHLSPSHKKRAVDILGRQMDTIWTPEPIPRISQKLSVTQVAENTSVA